MNNILFFGNCAASSIVVGMKELQRENQNVYRDMNIAYWAMPASLFLREFYYKHNERIVVFNKERPTLIEHDKQELLFIYDISTITSNTPASEMKKISRWRYLPKYITLPLFNDLDKNFIYCFCGNTFPYSFIWQMFMQHVQGKIFITEGMIESCVSYNMFEQLSLLKELKQIGLRTISIQGPHYLPVGEAFKKQYHVLIEIMSYAFTCMNNEIASIGIPIIPLPESMLDNQGFTDNKYRIMDDDHVHTNSLFGKKRFAQVMEELQKLSW